MATIRDDPYGAFNFLVDLGDGDKEGVAAGFREVSGLAIEVGAITYRNGNERVNSARKLYGLTSYPDVVLRRGVTGDLRLYQWIDAVRRGDTGARRTVRIDLLNEQREVVMSWSLQRAWPVKLVAPDLRAEANEVAIEELVLTHEGLTIE